ncbi:hypothetical protein FRB95_010990 [Tulasnella sp. JGI-2019a]|nr:hypothetical protein FRB93_006820 [Tulasnella sp. JGI-2019a]KAG9024822.1 hypothetical protein FRB95_010990 [Tulasnella sp. JGI-2019a]
MYDSEDPLLYLMQGRLTSPLPIGNHEHESARRQGQSNDIDAMLKQELKKKAEDRREIKVLRLGQSESGKSTYIKRKAPYE